MPQHRALQSHRHDVARMADARRGQRWDCGTLRFGCRRLERHWLPQYRRFGHTATLLPNGKVLVAGGRLGVTYLASAELYDPAPALERDRLARAARRLTPPLCFPMERCLSRGHNGTDFRSAELTIRAPARGVPRLARHLRVNHTATLLSDGKVLVAAGNSGGAALASAELYDPAHGTGAPRRSSSRARCSHRHAAPTARCSCCGRLTNATISPARSSTIGPPASGARPGSSSPRAVITPPPAAQRKVLVAGGHGNGSLPARSSTIRPPALGQRRHLHRRYFHTATLLPNGKVLVAAGETTAMICCHRDALRSGTNTGARPAPRHARAYSTGRAAAERQGAHCRRQ
jgi:hypothetical protein